MGEKSFFSTLAGQCARILALLGRLDEAEDYSRKSMEASPIDDWASQVAWREALALVEAQRGNKETAERLAREAVGMTEGVDYLRQMGGARHDPGCGVQTARRTGAAQAPPPPPPGPRRTQRGRP